MHWRSCSARPAPDRGWRPGGRAGVLPNLARMYTLGLDTIAGSKLLQLKFGRCGLFQPDEAVMHGDRRARFIRVSDGEAIIRSCGDSCPVAVPLETLSLPQAREHDRQPHLPPARADARRTRAAPSRRRPAHVGSMPRVAFD